VLLPPESLLGEAEIYDGGGGNSSQLQLSPALEPTLTPNVLLPPAARKEVVVPEVFRLIGTLQAKLFILHNNTSNKHRLNKRNKALVFIILISFPFWFERVS
jgi:hypothetical protein